MKGTFAASILVLILAGCNTAGPAPTTDPFFGQTRVPPPPTGTAQPIPPGTNYYQTPPGNVPSGSLIVPPGATLPAPPQNPAQPNPYIPLNGSPASPNQPYPVYPQYPQPMQNPAYPPAGSAPSRGLSPTDPFPNAGSSLAPVGRGNAYSANGDERAVSSESSIAQTTVLGSQGSRVIVPEKALVWQETPRSERATFGADSTSSTGGSLPLSGAPLNPRVATAFDASDRPISDRERITRTVGPGGRILSGDQASSAGASGGAAAVSEPSGSTAPGYLPRNNRVIDIMDLPPAPRQTDPNVRPTSAAEPVQGESGNNIYFRDSNYRPSNEVASPGVTTAQPSGSAAAGVYRGTLGYSEAHRRWCLDLDPEKMPEGIEARRILLADDLLLSGLERGDYVEMEGRLEPSDALASEFPVVKALNVLQFRKGR